MSVKSKALLWAAIIIAAAIIADGQGLSSAASTGIVLGFSGAALGALNGGRRKQEGCC